MTAADPHSCLWEHTDTVPDPGSNQVHVWAFVLDAISTPDTSVLDQQESDRAGAFSRPELRDRYIQAHIITRQILSSYLQTAPADVTYGQHANGKPFISNANLEFSLSHTGNEGLLSVSRAVTGIDIENEQRQTEPLKLARRFFSASEYQQLSEVAADRQQTVFLQAWTRKEAVVKCHGGGIASGLKDFSTLQTEPQTVIVDYGNRRESYYCCNLPGPDKHISAIAVNMKNPDIRLFRYKL